MPEGSGWEGRGTELLKTEAGTQGSGSLCRCRRLARWWPERGRGLGEEGTQKRLANRGLPVALRSNVGEAWEGELRGCRVELIWGPAECEGRWGPAGGDEGP